MTPQLSATELTLIRGERCLFRDLGFALSAGELLLLEGQNGSGKTSLIRALLGLLEAETGEILWNKVPIRQSRQDYFQALVWMAHRVGFKADLTLVENLQFEAALRAPTALDVDAVLERLGIGKLRKLPLRALSAGQQRRVALARVMLAGVPLWLLDEPFTNLDKAGRALVLDVVSEHLAAGGLCVIAAHQDVDIDATTHRLVLQ